MKYQITFWKHGRIDESEIQIIEARNRKDARRRAEGIRKIRFYDWFDLTELEIQNESSDRKAA